MLNSVKISKHHTLSIQDKLKKYRIFGKGIKKKDIALCYGIAASSLLIILF